MIDRLNFVYYEFKSLCITAILLKKNTTAAILLKKNITAIFNDLIQIWNMNVPIKA